MSNLAQGRAVSGAERGQEIVRNRTMKNESCSPPGARPAIVFRDFRIANIERLRILSAFGVASFHTHEWFPRSLGVIGFLILILTFCTFVVNKSKPYPLVDLAKRRAGRLLKPWLFWSAIYGGMGLIKVVYTKVPYSDFFTPSMILTGTRIHLWFLPFAFAAALLLALVHRKIVCIPDPLNIVVASFVGAVSISGCSFIQSHIHPPVPLTQWILGLPAIPLGLAIGRILMLQKSKDRRNYFILVNFLTLMAYVAYTFLVRLYDSTWFDFGSLFAIRYCISISVVCSALYWRGHLDSISRRLGSSSYGIYLVHPLVIIVLYQFNIAVQHPLVLLFLVLSASMLITIVFKKTPLRQFV
jgi:peptidoglycan/LPS O-acetylase OafA/YrhL